MTDDIEDTELHEISQEVGQFVKDLSEKVHPLRVALAGVVLLLLIGSLISTWYWVIPRDDLEIETRYLQRNGHVVMVELINDGSRDISDVRLLVEFIDSENQVIGDPIDLSFEKIDALTSISGDKMEMVILGYSVWEEYTISILIEWIDFRGQENSQTFTHKVFEVQNMVFVDDCDGATWFL